MISVVGRNKTGAGYGLQLSIGAPRSAPSFGAALRNAGRNCLTQYPLQKDLAASPQIQPCIKVKELQPATDIFRRKNKIGVRGYAKVHKYMVFNIPMIEKSKTNSYTKKIYNFVNIHH
jgi:hypothetical protein